MIKKFFLYLKIIFYVANIVLISLYIFPGSILGWILYNNADLQPQITSDFIVSSNHVYAFMLLSTLGYIAYKKENLNLIFIYLFSISILLEILHIFIPNRGFEFSDLFGNIIGVLLLYLYHQINKRINSSKNGK
jgi:VanZ family protein